MTFEGWIPKLWPITLAPPVASTTILLLNRLLQLSQTVKIPSSLLVLITSQPSLISQSIFFLSSFRSLLLPNKKQAIPLLHPAIKTISLFWMASRLKMKPYPAALKTMTITYSRTGLIAIPIAKTHALKSSYKPHWSLYSLIPIKLLRWILDTGTPPTRAISISMMTSSI